MGDQPLPDWAQRIVAGRASRRWSRRDLLRALRDEAAGRGEALPDDDHLSRSLRRWETGSTRPSEWYQELLRGVLDPEAADRAGAVGRTAPDAPLAEALSAVVHGLRVRDDTAPTGSLLESSAALADLTASLVADAKLADQRDLGRVAAEAAMMRWWLAVDAGRHDVAGPVHDAAMALAVEWGQTPLVGHLMGWRAGLAIGQGDLATAVRLARRARDPRWGVSAGGVAWAASYEARAHLLAGRRDDMLWALDDAQAAYAAVDPAGEPPWLYWLSGTVLRLDAADMQLLRDGPDAAPGLLAELGRLAPERARDAAWYWAHLAAARARAGDVDGAVADTAQAVRLSTATGTTWTLAELRQLAGQPGLGLLAEALADLR
jgi:hypothetical protein